MQDAENAVRAIEDFYERFRASTEYGRKLEMPKLPSLRAKLVSVCNDSYVMEKWTSLEDACKQLSRQRQPKGFNESNVISWGLGDVGNIRSWMARLGLVDDFRERYEQQD